ncbi:MAG: hypothetical protein ACW99G_23630 [Candidatus Thorarchaeota archaeon]|jgi:hypothetical protein
MMSEQVDIAKEWLFECCDASEDGKVCACTIKRYITHLEAELATAREDVERVNQIKTIAKEVVEIVGMASWSMMLPKSVLAAISQLKKELEEPHG